MKTKSAVNLNLGWKMEDGRWPLKPVLRYSILYLLSSILFVSCAATTKLDGPTSAAQVDSQPWSFKSVPGVLLKTPHYNIYTTEKSPDVLRSVPHVMEGALAEYQKIAPG